LPLLPKGAGGEPLLCSTGKNGKSGTPGPAADECSTDPGLKAGIFQQPSLFWVTGAGGPGGAGAKGGFPGRFRAFIWMFRSLPQGGLIPLANPARVWQTTVGPFFGPAQPRGFGPALPQGGAHVRRKLALSPTIGKTTHRGTGVSALGGQGTATTKRGGGGGGGTLIRRKVETQAGSGGGRIWAGPP